MQDIKDIIYTIPVNKHSSGIASKTPTQRFLSHPKFIPDYGGVIETTTSNVKSNSFFNPHPCSKLKLDAQRGIDSTIFIPNKNCLASLNLPCPNDLNNKSERLDTVLYTFKDQLRVQSLYKTACHISDEESLTPSNVCYPVEIWSGPIDNQKSSIKYDNPNLFTVNSSDQAQVYALNHQAIDSNAILQYARNNPTTSEYDYAFRKRKTRSHKSSILSNCICLVESIKLIHNDLTFRDSTINKFNNHLVALGGDSQDKCSVEVFDYQTSKNPIFNFEWPISSNASVGYADHYRKFIAQDDTERLLDLRHTQNHVAQIVVTTTHQSFLLDPRCNVKGSMLIDITNNASCYPIERLQLTKMSGMNTYQYYVLSNVHMRVYDSRWPETCVNQLNHMLDADLNRMFDMDIVCSNKNLSKETALCRTGGEVCFMSFGRQPDALMQNPRSLHLPYHEKIVDNSYDIIGSTALQSSNIDEDEDFCFSMAYLISNGQLSTVDYNSRIEHIKNSTENFANDSNTTNDSVESIEESIMTQSECNHLTLEESLLNDDENHEISSQKAKERFFKMKELFARKT